MRHPAHQNPILPHATTAMLQVARCADFGQPVVPAGPLDKILSVQAHLSLAQRQVPEPWRGHRCAPLLIIGSNPSIDPQDDTPRHSDSDATIVRYFQRGFSPVFPRKMVRDQVSGDHVPSARAVTYWIQARAIAADLWNLDAQELRPGIDFALTEVVPYKSKDETGVRKALQESMRRFWAPRIAVLTAPAIVVLGEFARLALGLPRNGITLVNGTAQHGSSEAVISWGGIERIVITLPHPSARAKAKAIRNVFGPSHSAELAEIARVLRAARLS